MHVYLLPDCVDIQACLSISWLHDKYQNYMSWIKLINSDRHTLLTYQGLPWLRICCSQHFSQMEKVGAK